MAHEAGKGDKRRPGDEQAFNEGYERIFGDKNPVRGRFIWDSAEQRMVPESEYTPPPEVNAPAIMGDIQPYKSMIDGSMIQSRSTHRQHLKQHGCIEVGNEKVVPKPIEAPKGLRDAIGRAVYQHLK